MANNMVTAAMSRQSGLMKELQTLANNIANAQTVGFRKEGVVFSEYVKALDGEGSVSMTRAGARMIDLTQGGLIQTEAPFDLAIEGEGFFLVETTAGPRLTRAGAFSLNANSELVDKEGRRVLGAGDAPIQTPPDAASIAVARDGSISADGQPVGRIAVVDAPSEELQREGDNLFEARNGYVEAESYSVIQGALEESNVNPMNEFARLIEVQRAYEAGKSFIDRENDRLRRMVEGLGREPV